MPANRSEMWAGFHQEVAAPDALTHEPRNETKQMFETQRVEIEWGGRKLTPRDRPHGPPGRRRRARPVRRDERAGDRGRREERARPGIDFFPLTVNYQEKTYAAGKIPGGYFKREGRPTEKETLTSRLIDRPIRPLFVDGFKNETQVVVTVLSHDMENDPDIVGHGRGLRRADALRRAVPRPDRRRPRRRHRRRVRAQPDDRRDGRERRSTSSSPAPATPS